MKLSVLIPVYNERYLINECLRRVLAAELPKGWERELVVVDDGSSDGTAGILDGLAAAQPGVIRLIKHERNRGKGAAIRTAVEAAAGDVLLIQDGDLEYDPRDYMSLLAPIVEGDADAVYGSRFLTRENRRALFFWHMLGNRALTLICNAFTNLSLTDMETGYKVVRAPFIKHLPLRCDRFGIEPELTIKLAKQRCRLYEVPIRYKGRGYDEGKKITAWDGVKAVMVMLWFWLVDDLYGPDRAGSQILHQLSQTPRFNRWMADELKTSLGHRVLEIGAGIGNLTALLCHRESYVTTDMDDYYINRLGQRFMNRPNVGIAKIDVERAADFSALDAEMDTVLCVNVLEHVKDDVGALRNMRRALSRQGRVVLLVPYGRWLYGTLDEVLEHQRRYDRESLTAVLASAGLRVVSMRDFNRISTPAWFWNGKILRRRYFGRLQLKLFDSMIWLFRRLDRFLPWHGQSLIVVAEPSGAEPSGRGSAPLLS